MNLIRVARECREFVRSTLRNAKYPGISYVFERDGKHGQSIGNVVLLFWQFSFHDRTESVKRQR
jgi:hypothetical protein